MIHKTAKLIHKLRVYFLIIIALGFFYNLGANPVDLGRFLGAKLGSAIGMSMSVPENPINKLAAQLREKEEGLDAREKNLDAREASLDNKGNWVDRAVVFMGAGIIVLFVLMAVNFVMDYRRRKEEEK